MFSRRTFLSSLTAFLGLGQVHAAPPENLPEPHAAPPETKKEHVHEWLPSLNDRGREGKYTEVQVCSHPECYAYKVYRLDHESADSTVYEHVVGEAPIAFLHEDYWEMSQHIVAYIAKTGAELLSSDNPMKRRIGFLACSEDATKDPLWEIPLTKLRNFTEDSRDQLVGTYLRTAEGRIKLAAAMEGAGKARRAHLVKSSKSLST